MRFDNPVATVAQRLNIASAERGIPQAELCARTGISNGSMSQYFSGYVSPKQNRIYLLAKALNVDEVWLMGYDVPMDKSQNPEEPKANVDYIIDNDAKYVLEMYLNLSIKNKKAIKHLLENLS